MGAIWGEFARGAPALAAEAERLFARYEAVILSTTAESGRARLGLVEPRVDDGRLVIGTESTDRKSADLRRDPRCSLHTLVRHRTHEEPVFKADLVAEEVLDPALVDVVATLARPEMHWQPTAAFVLSVERAVLVTRGTPLTWRSG